MATWTIYHNPKCSKSRKALELLRDKGIEPEVVEYLKVGLSTLSTADFIAKSQNRPEDFLRKKEPEFADYRDRDLESANSVAEILQECPKLLERPVVLNASQVIIARPPELVADLM